MMRWNGFFSKIPLWIYYLLIYFLVLFITALLVPVVLRYELGVLEGLPTNVGKSIEIGVGDVLTMATVIGGISVFVLDRYISAMQRRGEILEQGALTLIIKHIIDNYEPIKFDELRNLFINDANQRKFYCDGEFDNISRDDFGVLVYKLRFENQISMTSEGYIAISSEEQVKVKKLGATELNIVIATLTGIANSSIGEDKRSEAVSALAQIKDQSVVQILESYLEDQSSEVRLAAAKALIRITSF